MKRTVFTGDPSNAHRIMNALSKLMDTQKLSRKDEMIFIVAPTNHLLDELEKVIKSMDVFLKCVKCDDEE